jgi:hypothetical protein
MLVANRVSADYPALVDETRHTVTQIESLLAGPVAVSAAQVSGGRVTAASGPGLDFVMCVTEPLCEQVAELQQMLGEGPCLDAAACAAPGLAGDLDDAESGRRWPAFTPAARKLGAAAVFAFPLTIGGDPGRGDGPVPQLT